MGALDESVVKAMKEHAQAARQKMAGSGGGFKRWDIGGKNSIVEPGRDVVMRLHPRWDFMNQWKRDATGKLVVNPDYVKGTIYFPAREHWWTLPDGKFTREWCPKTFDAHAECPVCDSADELSLSGSPEDRQGAKDLKARDVFLYNASQGQTGKRVFDESGKLLIKYLPAPGTIFVGITNLMTGGDEGAFARGDISDPRDGYDIKLSRPPAGGGGERWKVDCAPKESPLHLESEKEAYKGWSSLLIDLPALVRDEMKTYEQLYKAFHGVDPAPVEVAPSRQPAASRAAPPKAAAAPVEDDPWATAETAGGGEAEAPVDPLEGLDEAVDMPPDEPPAPASRPSPTASAPRGRAPAPRGGRR